jgi:Zn-dependent protease
LWRKGTLLVSLAGPASNLLLATAAAVVFHLLPLGGFDAATSSAAATFVYYMIFINCALAFFNLIPLPPLDGSKILISLLPPQYEHVTVFLERYGPMILLGLIMMGWLMHLPVIWMVIGPLVDLAVSVLVGA